jgi:hypothetical protein
MTLPLCLCGMGMVTAISQTAEETFTAYEAGIRGFRQTPVLGLDGQPLVASLAMPVSPELTGLTRARVRWRWPGRHLPSASGR